MTANPNEAARVVEVGWTSAGEDPAYFEVWRADGNDLPSALLSAVPGSARSFSDASAVSGITYVYRVRAVSEAGLASSFSLGASAMLSNSAPPPPPTQVSVLADPGGYAARVEWLAADPAAVSSVVRYSFADRPGVTLEAGPTAGSALVIQGLRPQVDITFHVVSFDLSGRESAPSEGVTLQLIDREPPSPPPDVRIVPYPAGGALTLLWGQSTSLDVVAYRVLFFDPDRSSQFEVLAELPAGATSLFKDGLRNHVTYGLQVIAVDAEGNPSPPSDAAFGAPELQALPPTPSLDPMPPVTNQSPLEVTGSAGAGLWVELSVNAALSTVVQADASGRFSALLTLEAGDNAVWARTVDPLSTAHPEWRGSPPSPTAHTWFDADPPRVVWSRPDPRNDEATPETVIVIALSEAVVPATASITLRDADGLSWEGRLDYNETSQQLSFRPSRPLPWNVLLHVEVRATDLAGNALALHAFSFRTAAEPGTAGAPAEQGSFLAAFAPAVAFAAIATAAVALLRSRRRPGDPSALSPGEQNREGPP